MFLHRFAQLERILDSRGTDTLLDLALILRQVLVDGTTLTDTVNRAHRLKIRFRVGESTQQTLDEMRVRRCRTCCGEAISCQASPRGKYPETNSSTMAWCTSMANIFQSGRPSSRPAPIRLGGVHIEDPAGDSDEKSRYSAIEFRPDRWWGTGHVPHSLLRGGNPFARHWPNCTTG